MNPKEAFHNTAYSVQLPHIDGLFSKVLKSETDETLCKCRLTKKYAYSPFRFVLRKHILSKTKLAHVLNCQDVMMMRPKLQYTQKRND